MELTWVQPLVYLALSLLALIAAPLCAGAARRSPAAYAAMDAFVAVAIGGIALLHILPYAYRHAGALALAVALIGFLIPLVLHHGVHRWEAKALPGLAGIVLLGLALHAVVDGIALVGAGHVHGTLAAEAPSTGGDEPLALAVVLHRLPVALGIWWLALPLFGRRGGFFLLAVIGVLTVVGYALGESLWLLLSSPQIAVAQAAIAGMLFHVLLRHPGSAAPATTRAARFASAGGSLLGVALVLALAAPERASSLDQALSSPTTFVQLFLAGAPALLVGYGGLVVFHAWKAGRDRSRPMLGGAAGASVRAAVQAALPVIQLPALLLTWRLLGWQLTVLRVAAVLGVALAVAFATRTEGAAAHSGALSSEPDSGSGAHLGARLGEGLRRGFGLALDRTLPWILLGIGVAALVEPLTGLTWIQTRPLWGQIVIFAALGVPFSFAALGSLPIAALLVHKGFAAAPVAAFVISSAVALDHRRPALAWKGRPARLFAGGVLLAAIAGARFVAPALEASTAALHELASRPPALSTIFAGLALLGLLLAALFRRGFRGLFAVGKT